MIPAKKTGVGAFWGKRNVVDDFSADVATAGTVPINQYSSGGIDNPGDHDWFSIALTAGVTYRFEENGQASGRNFSILDPLLTLRDPAGNFITSADNILLSSGNLDSRIIYTAPISGLYFLDAGTSGGSETGTYAVRAITSDDEPTNTQDTTRTLLLNSVTGDIEVGYDQDWFAVQLNARHSYVFNARGSASGGGTLNDPTLSLHDAAGAIVASGQPIGPIFSGLHYISSRPADEQLVINVSQSGTYYVDAGGLADSTSSFGQILSVFGQTGTYTLEAADLGPTTETFPQVSWSLGEFGTTAGGWTSQDTYPRLLADVSGDGKADIIGFSSNGMVISRNDGGGHFTVPELVLSQFGTNVGGWTSQDQYPRMLADVDGVNRTDIIGFSSNGVVVSLNDGSGHFAAPEAVLSQFGINAGGWTSQDQYSRMLAYIDGDGRPDIIGFSSNGVVVSLSDGSGRFTAPEPVLSQFATNVGGWISQDSYPRLLDDINGDHRADMVGFSSTGVVTSLNDGSGHFSSPQFVLPYFGSNAGGWTSQDTYPRLLADVNTTAWRILSASAAPGLSSPSPPAAAGLRRLRLKARSSA